MKGRRSAALLCVLLTHALLIYMLTRPWDSSRPSVSDSFVSEPITLYLPPLPPEEPVQQPPHSPAPGVTHRTPAAAPAAEPATPAQSAPITLPGRVDWPLEGKKSAERVLAQEAEAERIAKMFAGPGGTWASLTKRQKSQLNKFRWKKGVVVEYDADGNLIYRINDGCMIINGLIACKIGKAKINDHMFDNMREYFDELRLPETNQGNGTEPEARRPAN